MSPLMSSSWASRWVARLSYWSLGWNVNKSRMNTWMSTQYGWTPRTLRSELPVGITTATTIIITTITTNPDSALPGSCCKLSTPWSLQHRDKWYSYLAKPLDESPVKVGEFKEDLDISYWLWFRPGPPRVNTTYPRSKPSPVRIDTLTRRVKPQSKATGTGS